MTVTLTYDTELSRVRIDAALDPIASYDFEVDVSAWEPEGGTLEHSTAQAHGGTGSALLTPDGTSSTARASTVANVAVVGGELNEMSAWVYSPNGYTVDISVKYFDSGGGLIEWVIWTDVTVAAATWTQILATRTAPVDAVEAELYVNMRDTPATSDELYIDDVVFRALTADVERSIDQVQWTTVRGGAMADLSRTRDDYEFAADVVNYYRVRGGTLGGGPSSLTPTLSTVWLKSIARPWLNRAVTVTDWSSVERPARRGVFSVVGRSHPVAVSDVRGSRRFELEVMTTTLEGERDFDLVLASGDPVFLHVPSDCAIPGGYWSVGDTTDERRSRRGTRRYWTLPLTEIAAPGPDVIGSSSTYNTVVTSYATYQDLLDAHVDYESVLELIGSPTEVIVP